MEKSWTKRVSVGVMIFNLLRPSGLPARQVSQEGPGYTLRVTSELVLVNVVARDGKGDLVRGLTLDDFTILEDGKKQSLSSFDFENVETQVENNTTVVSPVRPETSVPAATATPAVPMQANVHGHRLVVLVFDLTSMQTGEIERAVACAREYVAKRMAPPDLVAVGTLSSSFRLEQEFTSDRTLIQRALQRISTSGNQGYEEGSTGTTEGTPDTGQPFTPDESEYNIFSTNRKLKTLQTLAQSLARIEQKKSIIYFSSGVPRTGMENQSALRAATNAAIKANVSIYPMDMRGLRAQPPGGEAQQASLRGVAPYSGQSVLTQQATNLDTQETLVTLAGDTGGHAFVDSNDFARVFERVQKDTSVYYVLGYRSDNPTHDGSFRRITVRVRQPGIKLEYRAGYYVSRDFQYSSHEDREQQLQQELASDLPATDLTLLLSAGYFRQDASTFFVPVSLAVSGSDIPFIRESDKDRVRLDILGEVLDEAKHPAAHVRDTIALSIESAQEVRRKNVQYDTGFTLGPGNYHLKFVVRENRTGKIGSFETDLAIPDLKRAPLKMSSVILANQIKPAATRNSANPLVRNGNELIPSVTRVFTPDQHLYFYYEVYDPATEGKTRSGKGSEGDLPLDNIRLFTNILFFNGVVKTFETPVVELRQLNSPQRAAAIFRFDLPLSQFKPGLYTCQVNVVDDASGTFLFPRLGFVVRK